MTLNEITKTFFSYPVLNAPDDTVVLDACHDLKNSRNASTKYLTFCDDN